MIKVFFKSVNKKQDKRAFTRPKGKKLRGRAGPSASDNRKRWSGAPGNHWDRRGRWWERRSLGIPQASCHDNGKTPLPEQGTECHHPEKVLQQQQEILGPCDLASSKHNMKDSCQFHRLSGSQRGTSWVLAPAISVRRKASYLFGFYYYYFHYFMGLET